jgi:DNA polymerase-3 subunit gamma/tau
VWSEVLAAVQRHRRTTRILLEQVTVAALTHGALLLTVESPGIARRVSEQANLHLLRAALKEVLAVDVAVRVEPAAPARAQTVNGPQHPVEGADFAPDDEPAEEPEPDPMAPARTARHPDLVAVELLTQHVGATRIDPS